jgi:protein-disulfide isomerase
MERRFLLILVALVLVFGGFIYFNKKGDESDSNGNTTAQPSNHTYGNGKKNVTIVEYADFQCPACAGYFPIIKQVKEQYKEDVTFQFVNFPLDSIHPNARAAHRAGEAASNQGKFWEMHDLLYENQQSWAGLTDVQSVFEGYAQQLNLNIEQYKTDVAKSETNDIINADISEGQKLKVSSTPTFFINGAQIEETPRDVAGFAKLIDEAISKQSGSN